VNLVVGACPRAITGSWRSVWHPRNSEFGVAFRSKKEMTAVIATSLPQLGRGAQIISASVQSARVFNPVAAGGATQDSTSRR